MKDNNTQKPDWAPENAGKEFTARIVRGTQQTNSKYNQPIRSNHLSIEEYVDGVLNSNRTILAKTITLIESNSEKHFELIFSKIDHKCIDHGCFPMLFKPS